MQTQEDKSLWGELLTEDRLSRSSVVGNCLPLTRDEAQGVGTLWGALFLSHTHLWMTPTFLPLASLSRQAT